MIKTQDNGNNEIDPGRSRDAWQVHGSYGRHLQDLQDARWCRALSRKVWHRPSMKISEQIARDIREGTFPAKSEATIREEACQPETPGEILSRPNGSNADEWLLFLCDHLDTDEARPKGLEYVAVQIAEALDAAAKPNEVICHVCCGDKVVQPFGEGCEKCDGKGYLKVE